MNKKRRPKSGIRRLALFVALPLLIAGVFTLAGLVKPAEAGEGRVVVLGFDGMDYELVSRFMAEGELPNLQRLRDDAHLSPLWSTTPPESPVAWSAFITGTNPGKTGIFDFLRRNPETYFPELNMTDTLNGIDFLFDTVPISLPELARTRQGPSFWSYAAEAGVDTVGIMMPMNIPPEEAPGSRVLSGLGVPDMRKTMGTYVYYVDDITVAQENTGSSSGTEMGGRVIEVEREGNEITTFLPGPYSPVPSLAGSEITAPVSMTVDPQARTLEFRILNRMPFQFISFFGGLVIALIAMLILWAVFGRVLSNGIHGLGVAAVIFIIAIGILWAVARPVEKTVVAEINEGEWSDWIPVNYLVTDWVGVGGFFRVFFVEAESDFQVYLTPVSIDPRETKSVMLSYPAEFAPELLNRFGNFKTYGWDSETWALNENVIGDSVFMDDLLANWDLKAGMVFDLMKEDDWTLFSAVFQGTDHVSHMYWRFIDKTHPMYDPELDELYGDSILTVYKRADDLVGKVMDEILREGDQLIVMSDHGFQTWHKAVNINTWLVENGYLAEKHSVLGGLFQGSEDSSVYNLFTPDSQFFGWVDWSESRAYALGLGQIYINLEGRESQGIVTENERGDLIDEIIEGMRDMRDPETGEKLLVNVYRADEIYHGDSMEYAPDIVVGFAPGYRVSWQTCLGVAASDLVEVNARKWSGDHCSFDASTCRGVLFTTVPLTVDDPNIIDLTPSILDLFGIDKPSRCDGRVIF